jgi:hypothetical protein
LTPLEHANVTDRRQEYSRLFCSLLASHLQDTNWANCADYLHLPGQVATETISNFTTRYRVLVVPGAFSNCAENLAPAFKQGIEHLRSAHQIDADGLKYGGFYDSTESGRRVAEYIDSHWQNDRRPYIVVGYSKGAADALEAYVQLANAPDKIKALVSVAGAVGGSRLPDLLGTLWDRDRRSLEEAMASVSRSRCPTPDDGPALKSLARDRRMKFLAEHQFGALKRYSIVAVVDSRKETSRILRVLYDRVKPYSLDQDSQVIAEEGVLPAANVLGYARGDHWAVAMPFWELNDPRINRWVDKNKFPRTALLESAIRLVVRDLP